MVEPNVLQRSLDHLLQHPLQSEIRLELSPVRLAQILNLFPLVPSSYCNIPSILTLNLDRSPPNPKIIFSNTYTTCIYAEANPNPISSPVPLSEISNYRIRGVGERRGGGMVAGKSVNASTGPRPLPPLSWSFGLPELRALVLEICGTRTKQGGTSFTGAEGFFVVFRFTKMRERLVVELLPHRTQRQVDQLKELKEGPAGMKTI